MSRIEVRLHFLEIAFRMGILDVQRADIGCGSLKLCHLLRVVFLRLLQRVWRCEICAFVPSSLWWDALHWTTSSPWCTRASKRAGQAKCFGKPRQGRGVPNFSRFRSPYHITPSLGFCSRLAHGSTSCLTLPKSIRSTLWNLWPKTRSEQFSLQFSQSGCRQQQDW